VEKSSFPVHHVVLDAAVLLVFVSGAVAVALACDGRWALVEVFGQKFQKEEGGQWCCWLCCMVLTGMTGRKG